MGFSILIGNIFIIDEHNGNGYQSSDWMSMIFGNSNFRSTYIFLELICSILDFNFITYMNKCYDKGIIVVVTVGHCGDYVVNSGYGPHYISDTKRFFGFYFHCSKIFRDWHIYKVDCWMDELLQIPCQFYSRLLYSSNM